ncbi:DinB family protein [Peribacillus butanolivorans]|uniref:DinB family protein n=1 Tax=Peribacillus butanolivorans TaxID=421767 RepID=UPI00366F0887
MNLKAVLLEQMGACYEQKNWFVPFNIAIDGLSAEQASWKTGDSNSIWQIVNHLTFWNERYLNRFKGLPLSQEEVNNNATFNSTNPNETKEEWQSVVLQLLRVMSDWADAIKDCDEEKFHSAAYKESDAPWSSVIANINIHNAYHIGQIVEIRKAQGVWDSKNGVN